MLSFLSDSAQYKAIGSMIFALLLSLCVHGQGGVLKGQVLDDEEQLPLAYARVALYQLPDSIMLQAGLADSVGQFYWVDLPAGDFYLEVRFWGYEPLYLADFRLGERQQIDLGPLYLQASIALLEAVKIEGRQSQQYQKVDRQVYDAGQFQNAQGGTASDILRNLPSVAVNGQGEISVRGTSGFIIMLDGKPMQGDPMSILQQFPANAIEDIEIITAPSAQYDPDGKAGIINIKSRRGATNGFFLLT
ncbi:MAG: TonB-dependent receptor, partial [Bacteroidota bacterium]